MEQKEKELRAYNFEIRATNDEKHGNFVEGLPIVYDVKTDIGGMFEEIIDRGALDDADMKDVRFLVNHNTDMIPLARSRNNNENSTMQMSVADDGMHIRVNLDTENNTEAKNLYSAISRGDVSGMSFMFTVNEDRWDNLDTDYPTRHITKLGKIFEVSAVTFPAYEQTDIKARSEKTLENVRSELDSARAEAEKIKIESELRERELKLLELENK